MDREENGGRGGRNRRHQGRPQSERGRRTARGQSCSAGDRRGIRSNNLQSRGGSNHFNSSVRGSGGPNHDRATCPMGYMALQEIALASHKEIITKIKDKQRSFFCLLENSIPQDRYDMFPLLLTTIEKVCRSSFHEIKMQLVLNICNSEFLSNLQLYLMNLPYAMDTQKERNKLYWNNQHEFWNNFASFCQCIVDLSPSTALEKLRPLIDTISKVCLISLEDRHGFTPSRELLTKLDGLRERMTNFEKNAKEIVEKKKRAMIGEDNEPPECFRTLSLVPSSNDLMDRQPYLRPNIINGSYQNVEHYLDVQFRLLREDCFGPLREGVGQYINDPQRGKYDNIRVYQNVQFVAPYISNVKIGLLVQIKDAKALRRFSKINWVHNKRFIFGSLLLFSNDKFKSFIAATVLDRDPNKLSSGLVPVALVDLAAANNIDYNDEIDYIMVESEVYFEPYYHVLKVLQDPSFPEHLAMSDYIVNVTPVPKPPAYIHPQSVFTVDTTSEKLKFRILEDYTWPTKEDLGLNASQFSAYKLCLTHQFAVVQGPPGTGKTFLGVKIAAALLQNLIPEGGDGLMLVICYTNHALDQFLEAILHVTDSIVRIGNQSKNEAMARISLNNRRKKYNHKSTTFHEQRINLKEVVSELKSSQQALEWLNNGIISILSLKKFVDREATVFLEYYKSNLPFIKTEHSLNHWLFEHMELADFDTILAEHVPVQAPKLDDADDNINDRNGAIHLDDLVNTSRIANVTITSEFNIEDAYRKLSECINQYKNTNSYNPPQLRMEIVRLKSQINTFQEMSANRNRIVNLTLDVGTNISRIPHMNRWYIYFRWSRIVTQKIKEKLEPLQKRLRAASEAYEEARMMMDIEMLQGVKVIGMTTSGAARMRKLLQTLAPPVVIVEEAAEVLEQHIVTALTKDCEHLILIGDHQQLRPSAAHMKLARHFNIEISLFERMIKNGVHSRRLSVQHRMRPEIAALICPHIYPELENHPSVGDFPNVRGVENNLFFFTHNFMEENRDDNSSRSNHQEADMALRFANYLMQQDYEPEDITILAAYSGQMFYMRKNRSSYFHLSKVKMTVIDNYQGEESKIIILSLVRNNNDNKIGFLGTENRVCVALSRARHGFYMFGNMDILKTSSNLWSKIAGTLEENSSLGDSLKLKCENHPDQRTIISSYEDFEKVPEGGCLQKCNYDLPECTHKCQMNCHAYDREHLQVKCHFPCERVLCDLGHVCPEKCNVECGPCKYPMKKTLPCGHSQNVHCYIPPTDKSIKCTIFVTVTLPDCNHEVQKPCYQDIQLVRCTHPCEIRVDKCGHQCERNCHVKDDPDHIKYSCKKSCTRLKKGCTAVLENDYTNTNHHCKKYCYETCDVCIEKVTKKRSTCKHFETIECNIDVNEVKCLKNCAKILPCGHHCKMKCYQPCGGCKEMVKKTIPNCNHEVTMGCDQTPTPEMCTWKCERTISCGHKCEDLCRNKCDPDSCVEVTTHSFKAPCCHDVAIPCNIYNKNDYIHNPGILLQFCQEPCNRELACGHECKGTCSSCLQGRIHVPCKSICNRTNICGHLCRSPCSKQCPPCTLKCEVKCKHSRCGQMCGNPCKLCQEPCLRACPHGACTRRCGQPCSRAPCRAPCSKSLPCSHPCRGLCGEPCPNVCRICNPETFPTGFIGEEYDDDDKFIQLEDCKHVLEVDTLDTLMMGDPSIIQLRSCPYCRKPIINTPRYKDLVNSMLKTDINPIKKRIFGTLKEITLRKQQLETEMAIFFGKTKNEDITKTLTKLHKLMTKQTKVPLPTIQMNLIIMNILNLINDYYETYSSRKLTALSTEVTRMIKMLCITLNLHINKMSEQVQKDVGIEIKRLNYIIQLSQIFEHSSYVSGQSNPEIRDAEIEARERVFTWSIFEEENAIEALEKFEKVVKISGVVSKEDRDLVVKAIDSKAGSWYKCPNGHYYCIDACGGAMEVSKCADCGAAIGGQSHRLLGDNQHAGEVDNSTQSAWPVHNDLRNYALN